MYKPVWLAQTQKGKDMIQVKIVSKIHYGENDDASAEKAVNEWLADEDKDVDIISLSVSQKLVRNMG
jgi:hypothetical protein